MSTPPGVVLILEEGNIVREKLRPRLDESIRIVTAADFGTAPIDELERRPDFVISDVGAVGGEGLALSRRLQADSQLDAVPALLLVPPFGGRDAEEERGQGIEQLLPAPLDSETLRRLVASHLPSTDVEMGRPVPPERSLKQAVKAVVERRLSDSDLAVGDLAEAVDLSRRHLTRRMKEAMGTTPAAYIRRRRLDRAERLLAAGAETIAQVAEAVGFASASAFSKAFREHAGCPPSTYADRHAE